MQLRKKITVMNKDDIKRAMRRIAHEILERNASKKELAIVGIKNRGMFLAERLVQEIKHIDNYEIPIGALDITLYRDDLTQVSDQPVLKGTDITFDITGKKIVLVDDVLFTGRTIRCAMDELIDFGRPSAIQLAVLIDRGHRELPVKADYVGKNIPTSLNEAIEVRLSETDGVDEVVICGQSKKT